VTVTTAAILVTVTTAADPMTVTTAAVQVTVTIAGITLKKVSKLKKFLILKNFHKSLQSNTH
jgi:hypothetical protein